MDVSIIQDHLAGRQPLVWIAAATIALGTACLVGALLQYGRLRRAAPRRQTPVPPTAAPVAAVAPDGDLYRPVGVTRAAPAADLDAPSLALLLRRLRAAGDRLETVATDLDNLDLLAPESFLKEARPEVEYVFRASGA